MPKAMTEPVLSTIKKGDKHCQHKLYSSVATLLNMPLSTRATSQCSAYQHVRDSSGNLTPSANVTAVQTCVVNKVIFKCYSAWPRKIEIMTFTKKTEARLDIRPTSLEVIGFMVKSVSLG